MTQQQLLATTLQDATFRLINLLERYSEQIPLLDEELDRHHRIAHAMVEQTQRAELSLNAWRVALAHRWDCEIAAQRAYNGMLRQLGLYYGGDPAYIMLIALPNSDAVITPTELLRNMRRLEASLELLTPRPPFADEVGERLHRSADELALAIEQTDRCETERRSILAEQRLASQLLQRAYERTHSLLTRHLTAADLALLPLPTLVDMAA
jgi:hypothetical protein